MASTFLLSLSLSFLVLFHGCLADHTQQQQPQQQHRVRGRTECRLERLSAQEPNRRVQSEAGMTEFWDQNNEEFDCAGVAACRNIIQPKGLLLPQYTNAPQLVYVVQGRGILGTVIPGCPETYESEQQSTEGDRRRTRDRHQKLRRFREGDIIALPAGVANWAYNDGEVPLVTVTIGDTGNDANQLDQNLRKFLLAGNLRQGRQQQKPCEQEQERQRCQQPPQEGRGQREEGGNIFNGFDEQILADALNVHDDLVRKIQGQHDQRGRIVRVEKELRLVSPRWEQEEEREGEMDNGFEETLCTMRLGQNIANPRRADVYNPRGGRITSLNSQKLPILNYLQLSAERGILYRNAIMAPHWNMNAHSCIYITRGSGRIQIVNQAGKSAFDDQVREGQLIIVPQNFVILKKASDQGLEWVAFKTNDNAKTSPLAGRLSALRGMPEEVLMNSYDISREDARNLKYNRQELTVFGPSSRSQGEYA